MPKINQAAKIPPVSSKIGSRPNLAIHGGAAAMNNPPPTMGSTLATTELGIYSDRNKPSL